MKRITKKQDAAFCKAAAALIDELGFARYPERHLARVNDRRIMTDLGLFRVNVPQTGFDHYLHDITGRFPDTSLFETWGSPERKRALAWDVALPSGKWNVLYGTPDAVLNAFRKHMEWAHARPLTPEETAADDALLDADAAKWAAWRAEENLTH